MKVVKVWDREPFTNTGWQPKIKKVSLPSGKWRKIELYFRCETAGDPWDRLYSFIVNDVELHRGITPFGASVESTEDVTHLAGLLKGEVETKTIITTYVGSPGWYITVELRFYEGEPPSPPMTAIPVFTMQRLTTGDPVEKPINAKGVKAIRIHATGHSAEEGVSRTIVVKADDREIARFTAKPWRPGQGRVEPYTFTLEKPMDINKISVQVIGGGSYWMISLSLLTTAPALAPPSWLPLILALAPIIASGVVIAKTKIKGGS